MTPLFTLVFAYAITGWLGLQMPFEGSHITLVWLPTGIAVAALWRFGLAVWPGIFLGALLVNLAIDASWPLATGIAVGNTLGPILTLALLRRMGFHAAFDRQKDMGLFSAAALAGMTVSASGGCASLYLAGLAPPHNLGYDWLAWWLGDTVGVLMVAPFLITLTRDNLVQLGRAKKTVLPWMALTGVVFWLAFFRNPGHPASALPLAFLTLPLIAWAALQFGMTGATLAALGYSLVAAWSTATGHGVFIQPETSLTLILLWSYIATVVLTALLLTTLQAERLRVENTLRESELQLRTLIESQPECVKTVAEDGTLLHMNRAGLAMIDADSADQVVGKRVAELIALPYRQAFLALTQRAFAGESGTMEFQIRSLKGVSRWLHSHTVPMRNAKGAIISALSVTRDITERKHTEEQLRIAASAFESQEGMMITDANSVILRVNRAFTEITGYTAEDAVGQTPRLLRSGRHDADFYRAMWKTIQSEGQWQGEIWDRRKTGEVFPKWLTITAVKDENKHVTHYIGTQFDITARKQAEEKILELAYFDQLTGLPNRTLLLDRLQQTMATSARDGCYAALLFIDLDHFKTLNDTLGHDMGDVLLRQVAQRILGCVREIDTVARLGGDEFVVLLTRLGTGDQDAADSAERVAAKIHAALNLSFSLGGSDYRSTPSMGVTLFKGQHASMDTLMKQADLAMYRSKAAGRNAVRFFHPSMELAVAQAAALVDDLDQTIA